MSASPTATQLFGPNPWVTDPAPGGTGPYGNYLYNNTYFATLNTANVVKDIVELGCKFAKGSCKVVLANDMVQGGPFSQNQQNYMTQIPDGSLHNAGRIALEFQSWQSIEPINSELSQEFQTPFVYTPVPAPTTPVLKPTAGVELMVAKVGGTAMQADGTTWKRLS